MSPDVAPVPFDPELEAALPSLAELAPAVITPAMIPSRRGTLPDVAAQLAGRAVVRDELEVPADGDRPAVAVTVLRPERGEGDAPGMLHIHGGGMFSGTRLQRLGQLLDWVERFGLVIVSPEYRLAPEHPHPAPVEDCAAALDWMVAQAPRLGVDPGRVLVAGVSAGGALAAGVTLLARDRGGPAIAGQLLIDPMLDDRVSSVAMRQYDELGVFGATANRTGWDALLGEGHAERAVPAAAAPARAADLAGLPPAFVDVGAADSLRDEAVEYASRLWAAGVDAELHVWAGAYHGYEGLVPEARVSRDSAAARDSWLRRRLEPPS